MNMRAMRKKQTKIFKTILKQMKIVLIIILEEAKIQEKNSTAPLKTTTAVENEEVFYGIARRSEPMFTKIQSGIMKFGNLIKRGRS